MIDIFRRKKKQLTIPDDPALPVEVREFAEKHASGTNIIELLNDVYEHFNRNPIAREKRYTLIMEGFQELMHEEKRRERREHLIKLLSKKKRAS